MEKPIAYFGYTKLNNIVTFQNLSLNAPTIYKWEFGDETAEVNQENPVHTYSEPGIYDVTLTVSKEIDGQETLVSEPLTITIDVGSTNVNTHVNLLELVNSYIPAKLLVESSLPNKIRLIQYWQTYLQPLVEIPFPVEPLDTHNETKWPTLVNNLIAQLVAKDILLQMINKFLISVGGQTIGSDENIENQARQIKSIETGPAKTEWFEAGDSTTTKDLSSAYAQLMRGQGPYNIILQSICQLSQRVRIFLPMCGPLIHGTTVPKIYKKTNSGHNANPFGITKRML